SHGLARLKQQSRIMYKTLCPHAIGVRTETLSQALAAAKIGGFEGLEFPANQVADLVEKPGATELKKTFAEAGIRPPAFSPAAEWRKAEAEWKRDLAALPR